MVRTAKMKPVLLLATTILSTTLAQQPYATKSFDQPCTIVQPAAVSFIQRKGLALAPDTTCNHCFIGTTGHLRDPRDHAVSTRTAMKRYMDLSKNGKDAFGAWYIHNGLEATARLSFQQTQTTCAARLSFFFSWHATEFRGAMPVDGDKASRPSNLHLETEYLDAIANAVPSPAPNKPK